MALFNWLHWLRTSSPFSKGHRRSTRKKSASYKLWMEQLEDRTVPSVSVVNNGGLGYTGLDFNQSGGYVPPDTAGAAGPSSYVETVNQEVALYSPKATGATQIKDSLAHFLFTTGGLTRADGGSGLSDPIVTYDELAGRFVIGDQDVNFSSHVSNFDLAVSKTSNPTTLTAADWNFYKITTTESGFDADYPGNFGYNQDGVVFTLNMFSVSGGAGHVQVVAVNSSDLTTGVTQANLHTYKNDLADFSVRATTMHGSVTGDPMWLVTEHGDRTSIDVIKMTPPVGGTILSNADTFTYTNLAVAPYADISTALPRNPNNTVITNNIDSRIMKAAEVNGILVATHAVSVSSTQDVAQWYAIDVSSGTPTLSQQGRVSAGANTYIYYPGIDINSAGQIGMSYMKSGTDSTTDYMSMWVTGRTTGDTAGTMQTPVIVPAGTGQANYHDPYNRAGDLSGINVDPVDGTFWAANEFANTEATANWGTAIANFTLTTPISTDLAVTNSGPASVTAGTTATYTITLTNNGPNPAAGVVLTDLLPTGSSFVSITPGGTNPDTFSFAQSGGAITESATASVAAGNTDVFTLVVFAPSNLSNGANFSDTASVSSTTSDPNLSNNSATVTGTIVNSATGADLAVIGSGPATSTEGANVTYSFTVTNNGPTNALSVVLTNTLGVNLSFVSAFTPHGSFSQSGGVVTFSLGTMVSGSSVTVTVTAKTTEDGSLTDSSSVTSGTNDPNPANNNFVVTTPVSEPPISVSAPITTTTRNPSNLVVATFTHASAVEPTSNFSAIINWGDGTTSAGTVTLSGTTYRVRGSHSYQNRGSHTITATVTEIGNAAQLLRTKIGDEIPALPDRFASDHDYERLDSLAELLGAIPGAGSTRPNDAAILDSLVAAAKKKPDAADLRALLGKYLNGRGGNVMDDLFSIDDSL